jgi:hypothetical protein
MQLQINGNAHRSMAAGMNIEKEQATADTAREG